MRKIILLFIFLFAGYQAYAQTEFITTWKTDNPGTSNATSITIPTTGSGYNYDVSWNNDGVWETGFTGNATHDYETAGTYTVAIRGSFPRIYFNNTGDRRKILSIEQWGTNVWSSMNQAFFGCSNLVGNATDAPELSVVSNMTQMFSGASAFNGDINNWDVSNVSNMGAMFYGASAFNQNLSNWNLGKVTDMSYMFHAASTFNGDITNWDVSNITLMHSLFRDALEFNQDIGNWDVSNVTNMYDMFNGAYVFNGDIGSWDVGNVTNMGFMFNAAFLFNQNIGTWNVGDVINMASMFQNARAFNQNLSNWNVGNVTNISGMFLRASTFNGDIGTWDLGKVIDLSGMFYEASSFNQNIVSWNVSNVSNMSSMFYGASSFNQNIGAWDVSNVTNMGSMFNGASAFDQDLGAWDVGNVTTMVNMFMGATLSTANYDALLNGWNSLILKNGVRFDGGNSKYCSGKAARENIINSYSWTILDGGLDSSSIAATQDITVQLDASGNASITGNDVDNGSHAGCSGETTYSVSPNTFDCSNIGANQVTLTVSDGVNTVTGTARVTVEDRIIPMISCPVVETVEGPFTLPDYFAEGLAIVTDNCTDPVLTTTQVPAIGTELSDGTHTITFTAEDSSGNTTTCNFKLTVDSSLSIADAELNTKTIRLYPNPAKHSVVIENHSNARLQELAVYDLIDRLVKTIDLQNVAQRASIDVSNLDKATYFINITTDQGRIVKQFIKN